MAKTRKPTTRPKTETRTPRWQVVENVVAAIERARGRLPGLVITQKAQLQRLSDPSDTRDVDVLVEVPTGPRTLRVAIEVKGKKRPVTIDLMGCICDLRRDIAVDRFCVVSTSGFTAGAVKKAAENNIELTTLEEFETGSSWVGPPVRTVEYQTGAVLHCRFDFPPQTPTPELTRISEALEGVPHDDVSLIDDTGRTTLTLFVSAMFRAYFKGNPRANVDGAVITLNIDMRQRLGLRMEARGATLPRPDAIEATARIGRDIRQIQERRFRFGDLELATAEMDLLGQPRQVSLIAAPNEEGAKQLKLSIGLARPPPVRR